jgi:Zn-dependent protease
VDYPGRAPIPGAGDPTPDKTPEPEFIPTAAAFPPSTPFQHGHYRQEADGTIVDVPIEKTGNRGGLGALAMAAFALLFKFKFALSILLNVGVYAVLFGQTFGPIFGVAFAAGFVALIYVHEMGHLIAARMEGVKATAPFFIPFMGAAIFLKSQPRDARSEAIIGIGGPITGTLGAIAVYAIAITAGPGTDLGLFFAVLASYGFLINLFNMIPLSPLDGGRILGAVSRWFGIIGLGLIVVLIGIGALKSPIAWLVVLLGGYGLYQRFTQPEKAGYYDVPPMARAVIGLAYMVLLVILVGGLAATEHLLVRGGY